VANPAVELSAAATALPAGNQATQADMASLPLGPAPGSARAARDFTTAVLGTWGLAGALPDARLVVSELVTTPSDTGWAQPHSRHHVSPARRVRLSGCD